MDQDYFRLWSTLASIMYTNRNRYIDNAVTISGRLGLNEMDSRMLALYESGMSQEAIGLKLNMEPYSVMMALDRILNTSDYSGR